MSAEAPQEQPTPKKRTASRAEKAVGKFTTAAVTLFELSDLDFELAIENMPRFTDAGLQDINFQRQLIEQRSRYLSTRDRGIEVPVIPVFPDAVAVYERRAADRAERERIHEMSRSFVGEVIGNELLRGLGVPTRRSSSPINKS